MNFIKEKELKYKEILFYHFNIYKNLIFISWQTTQLPTTLFLSKLKG